MKKVELLAPAGSFDKLKIAFLYGADACYLGGQFFGLRANADNFTDEQMKEAVLLANSLGKKIYVTCNILSRDQDLPGVVEYAKFLENIGVHGVIVADIGTFMLIRENCPKLPIHVSTQANNLNWKTIEFWLKNGATRVNLARELSLDEIREIDANLKLNCPECISENEPYLEAFVHGAMCMSFSGRCMLSDYLTGRSSNRGDCAQPCRWNYYVAEETRPGEFMPVYENERGTFIFNSKDLCMLPHIEEIVAAGATSLKIEGRMKSEFYTATIVRAYRMAIDAIYSGKFTDELKSELLSELTAVSHRDYSTGFYFGEKGSQIYSKSSYDKDTDFIGIVEASDNGRLSVRLRGAIYEGDSLEIITYTDNLVRRFNVSDLRLENGNSVNRATVALKLVTFEFSENIPSGSIVRKRI